MKLSKTIPARTKTVKFAWVYKNFAQATEKYLMFRNNLMGKGSGTMTRCDWCRKPFKLDEWFALASPLIGQEGPKRNWSLCHACADTMSGVKDYEQIRERRRKKDGKGDNKL